jgi:hypothetical protein
LRTGEDVLRGLEDLGLDDRGVHLLFGPDPLAGVIPAHLRLVTQRDVFDIQEDLGIGPGIVDEHRHRETQSAQSRSRTPCNTPVRGCMFAM